MHPKGPGTGNRAERRAWPELGPAVRVSRHKERTDTCGRRVKSEANTRETSSPAALVYLAVGGQILPSDLPAQRPPRPLPVPSRLPPLPRLHPPGPLPCRALPCSCSPHQVQEERPPRPGLPRSAMSAVMMDPLGPTAVCAPRPPTTALSHGPQAQALPSHPLGPCPLSSQNLPPPSLRFLITLNHRLSSSYIPLIFSLDLLPQCHVSQLFL